MDEREMFYSTDNQRKHFEPACIERYKKDKRTRLAVQRKCLFIHRGITLLIMVWLVYQLEQFHL